MMAFLQTVFSGKDNVSGDIGRILLMVGIVTLCGLKIYVVTCRGEPLNEVEFMTSVVGMLSGGAAALKIKASTEPGG
jgi:hypothetical protein